jgi:hypothetical protein
MPARRSSAMILAFAASRDSRSAKTAHAKITVSSSVAPAASTNERLHSALRSSAAHSVYCSAPCSSQMAAAWSASWR